MEPQIALIGTGKWGMNYVGALKSRGMLGALVDSDDALRDSLRHRGIDRPVFRSLEELLEEGPQLDGVVIATPAWSHFGQAMAALRRHVAVLVEKPIARSYSEALELYETASSAGVTLMAGHLLLHHQGLNLLWGECQSGRMGDIAFLRSTRVGVGRIRSEEDVLWSFGVHDLVLALTLVGRLPVSVRATKLDLRGSGVADVALVDLSFPGRLDASIHVSWLGPEREHRLLMYSSTATARFDDGEPSTGGGVRVQLVGDIPGAGIDRNVRETADLPTVDNWMRPLDRQVEKFGSYVAKGVTPSEDRAVALAVMKLLDAANEASASGQEVELDWRGESGRLIRPSLMRPSGAWTLEPVRPAAS